MSGKPEASDMKYWLENFGKVKDGHGNEFQMISVSIPWHLLRSGHAPDSSLKVRKVLRARMLQKVEHLKGGYMTNFPFSVRANGDGTFTVFDGNHRYHAIQHYINQGDDLPDNPYTKDFAVPCIVYKNATPDPLAMAYASLTNDVQRCAAGGTAMDFLRFTTNIKDSLKKREGYVCVCGVTRESICVCC